MVRRCVLLAMLGLAAIKPASPQGKNASSGSWTGGIDVEEAKNELPSYMCTNASAFVPSYKWAQRGRCGDLVPRVGKKFNLTACDMVSYVKEVGLGKIRLVEYSKLAARYCCKDKVGVCGNQSALSGNSSKPKPTVPPRLVVIVTTLTLKTNIDSITKNTETRKAFDLAFAADIATILR